MELREAMSIVLELAEQNALDLNESDPDLKAEAERQDQAIDCVQKWMRHAL